MLDTIVATIIKNSEIHIPKKTIQKNINHAPSPNKLSPISSTNPVAPTTTNGSIERFESRFGILFLLLSTVL